MSSFIAIVILKPFLPAKEWMDVYELGAKLISGICLVYFTRAIGINPYAVLQDWWKDRTKHLQLVVRYFAVYAGFMLLVMGILVAVFILFERTGMINSSLTVLTGNTAPNDKLVRLKFLLESSIPRFTLSLVSICILAPVIEEVFFRRFLFVALRKRMNFILALLISSVLFTTVHPNVALGAIGGIYLGYVYEKGKSLPANILIHSIVNLTVVTISMILT